MALTPQEFLSATNQEPFKANGHNGDKSPTLKHAFGDQPEATQYAFGRKVDALLEQFGAQKSPENEMLEASLKNIQRLRISIETLGGKTARDLADLKIALHRDTYNTRLAELQTSHHDAMLAIMNGDHVAANDETPFEVAA